MWIDSMGNNLTSAEVCVFLRKATGSYMSTSVLEETYRIGAVYKNGGIFFQRVE